MDKGTIQGLGIAKGHLKSARDYLSRSKAQTEIDNHPKKDKIVELEDKITKQ